MMNIEDFRNMFRAHLSHEIWDKWRKGQLDVSMRRNTPDGCEYEELPKEAADQILDGGEIHSCEDLADPTEVISDRYACSLYGITTFKPSEYAIEEDFPNEVVLRGGALVGRALETLRAGGYLIVDELENSINKQLVFAIMDLFASPVTNPHGATLLFSTHYPELLDHFTRKDSIWFAVRDGKGFALRNLGAYLGRTDLKKSVSFFANRVPGTAPSYAAVRALQDYAERYVHA